MSKLLIFNILDTVFNILQDLNNHIKYIKYRGKGFKKMQNIYEKRISNSDQLLSDKRNSLFEKRARESGLFLFTWVNNTYESI